jgi:hypothetical protein
MVGTAQDVAAKRGSARTRDDPPMCRAMRHHRQPAAGMAPILDAAPHSEETSDRAFTVFA